MIRHIPRDRDGYTILELMVVIIIILILGAIVAPSLLGFWGNNRTKAAVDMVTARLADARGAAIGQGRAYRVCASPDGLQIRVCVDESEQSEELATEQPSTPISQVDTLPKGVIITPMSLGSVASETDGWTTLVVFLPDGTCREDAAFDLSEPAEPDLPAQRIRVRAMTGVWTVNPATADTTAAATSGTQP